jgi:hypothetical protein
MSAQTNAYPGAPIERLKFLMRSGNAFMVDGVTHWDMKHLNGRCIELTLEQLSDSKYARVLVESIDLGQIEAVVLLPVSEPGRRGKEESGN